MHLEFLVEDQSGKRMLNYLVPKIIENTHTYKVHSYKGIGHIPRNMKDTKDASKRILLENLPKLLKGYGRTFNGYPPGYSAAVILVCDLDDKCLSSFRQELITILNSCGQKPMTQFCFAIEEGEAWFLGDFDAIKTAFPKVKIGILDGYTNDSICGTWEKLADAVYRGGSKALKSHGYQAVGTEKSDWAEKITPHMNVLSNKSPSFCYFRDKLLKIEEID